jgi:hypothetical protein
MISFSYFIKDVLSIFEGMRSGVRIENHIPLCLQNMVAFMNEAHIMFSLMIGMNT